MQKKITLIGTDSTHCLAFARLLKRELVAEGWRITAAVRDQRSQLRLSQNRYQQIEQEMEQEGIAIFTQLEKSLINETDAFIIASVDGSLHLTQFEQLVGFGKPIFIDKPLTYSAQEGATLFATANRYHSQVMSCSSLRFSAAIKEAAVSVKQADEQLLAINLAGPMPIEPDIPGLFWYGIHLIELLLTLYPADYQVESVEQEQERLIIKCAGGKIRCQINGDLTGQGTFRGEIVTKQGLIEFDQGEDSEPLYAYLVKEMLDYFETGHSPVTHEQTSAVISLVEKINTCLKS